MKPPSIFALLGGAAIAITWGMTSSLWSKKQQQEQHLPRQLLPRFFLLQALVDKIDELSTISEDDLLVFCDRVKDALTKIKVTIQTTMPSKSGTIVPVSFVERVISVIDMELLRLIQANPTLAELLHEDVPSNTQTWAAFVDLKLSGDNLELKELFEAELEPRGEYQNKLLESSLDLVCQLIDQFKQLSNKSTSRRDQLVYANKPTSGTRSNKRAHDQTHARPSSSVAVNDYTLIKVFYATDRKCTVDGDYTGVPREMILSGGTAPDSHCASQLLHYGMIEVAIPKSHERGTLDLPSGSEEADPSKHMVILSVDTTLRNDQPGFFAEVNRDVTAAKKRNKNQTSTDILIFVHGYRASLKKAVKRAAQMKKDVEFDGPVILYSWSSKGTPWGYFQDEKDVKKTVPLLENFILKIREQENGADRIHLMAQSMGNRALVRALTNHVEKLRVSYLLQMIPLSQVVLAAADETFQNFVKLVKTLHNFKEKMSNLAQSSSLHLHQSREQALRCLKLPSVTVYCSTDDRALKTSQALHLGRAQFTPRLGDLRSYLSGKDLKFLQSNNEFVDVVDATGMDTGITQHSYCCEVEHVLDDVMAVLKCQRGLQRARSHVQAQGTPEHVSFCQVQHRDLKLSFYTFNLQKLLATRMPLEPM